MINNKSLEQEKLFEVTLGSFNRGVDVVSCSTSVTPINFFKKGKLPIRFIEYIDSIENKESNELKANGVISKGDLGITLKRKDYYYKRGNYYNASQLANLYASRNTISLDRKYPLLNRNFSPSPYKSNEEAKTLEIERKGCYKKESVHDMFENYMKYVSDKKQMNEKQRLIERSKTLIRKRTRQALERLMQEKERANFKANQKRILAEQRLEKVEHKYNTIR